MDRGDSGEFFVISCSIFGIHGFISSMYGFVLPTNVVLFYLFRSKKGRCQSFKRYKQWNNNNNNNNNNTYHSPLTVGFFVCCDLWNARKTTGFWGPRLLCMAGRSPSGTSTGAPNRPLKDGVFDSFELIVRFYV